MILFIILSSLWAILIFEFKPFQQLKEKIGLSKERKIFSSIPFVDYLIYIIHYILNCPNCMSCYILFFSYLIINCSFIGFIYMPVAWILTFIINNKIMVIEW